MCIRDRPRTHQPEAVLDDSSWSNPYVDLRSTRAVEEEVRPAVAQTVEAPALQPQAHSEPAHFMSNADRFTRDNRAMTGAHAHSNVVSGNNFDDGDNAFDDARYSIPAYLRNNEANTPAIFRNGDPRF